MKLSVHLLLCAAIVSLAPILGAEPTRPTQDAKPSQPAPLFAEVMVLHAANTGKGIDPRIGEMPELGNAPFSAYDSYSLLDRAGCRSTSRTRAGCACPMAQSSAST